jgi:hypothetical protein
LSGTPFNTNGGSLALCETKEGVDPDTGKLVRQTLPTFTYSYGEAILEEVCRRVQFVKVSGHANVTYRSLVDRKFFEKIINTARKTDKIGVLLNPEGDFMQQCIREGLAALASMRDAGDKRAGMLLVAKSIEHGNRLMAAIENIKQEKPEWMQFSNIQCIYNDSEGAQKRIKALEDDNTDIVISVRMISEGVDVKRLRVGVYATDWMTRMFFTQFVGRFVRYEVRSPLDQAQHGVIVIPAHPLLLQWCREVEQMILVSQIKLDGDEGGPPPERKNEFVSSVSAADELGLIYQGRDIDYDKAVVELMCQKSPLCKTMAAAAVIQLAKDFGFANSNTGSTPPPINWRKRNTMIVTSIVGHLRYDHDLPDSELYSRVNSRANGHVRIPKVDAMTPDDVLEKRWHFLQQWLVKIIGQRNPDIVDKAS